MELVKFDEETSLFIQPKSVSEFVLCWSQEDTHSGMLDISGFVLYANGICEGIVIQVVVSDLDGSFQGNSMRQFQLSFLHESVDYIGTFGIDSDIHDFHSLEFQIFRLITWKSCLVLLESVVNESMVSVENGIPQRGGSIAHNTWVFPESAIGIVNASHHHMSRVVEIAVVILVEGIVAAFHESAEDVDSVFSIQRNFLAFVVNDVSDIDTVQQPFSPSGHILDIYEVNQIPEVKARRSTGIVESTHQGCQMRRVTLEFLVEVMEGDHTTETS